MLPGFAAGAELLAGAGLVFGRASIQRERRGKYQTSDTLEFKGPLDPARIDAGITFVREEVMPAVNRAL